MTHNSNWVLLIINQGATTLVVLAFGIVNLVAALTYPVCGTRQPLLSTWVLITGIIQLVLGVAGVLVTIVLCLNTSTPDQARKRSILSIVYLALTHATNIALAIFGIIRVANYASNCDNPIKNTLFGSTVTAFVLPIALILFTGIWFVTLNFFAIVNQPEKNHQ